MPLSPRKIAASHFLEQIRKSNALHDEYLGNGRLLQDYDRFTRWQLDYLLHFFRDLYDREGHKEALDFIISDLAGIGIADRDRDLERAAPAIKRLLPVKALQTIASGAEANARVLEINIGICRSLASEEGFPELITERDYFVACREAAKLEDCLELVHLIAKLGETLDTLIRIPLIGMTLRAMRRPARATGFGALQEFLEAGFVTFSNIPDVDEFLHELETRSNSIFERIYTLPLEQLHDA